MEQPEQVWLARYRNGDVEALGRLVEHYRRPLFGFILSMTEGGADADEIFQEVWLRAITHLDTYKPKRFLSWLFRIAHNLVIDRARKGKRIVSMQGPRRTGETVLQEQLESPGPGPDTEAAGRDLGRRIEQAAAKLPAEQREVFWMRARADLPFREIARIQGVSINTALARMQYALAKLREELKEEHQEISRR